MHFMEKKLSVKERQELINCHRRERDKKICDRIKAVLAYDDGYNYSEIARILLLDDETIRRHIEDYFSNKKLKPENGGSQSYLTNSQTLLLKFHLEETTYLYVKDICDYVKKTFKKSYSISGMTKWLQENGFRYKKPHGIPAKANSDQQESFIKYYNKLKAKTLGKEPIYFADSAHPQHQTQLAYGWIPKGVRREIAMTGRQYRLNYIGGICLDGHKIIYEQTDKVAQFSIQSFLSKLRKKHPENKKIHLIWDNAGYHRSKAIKTYAKKLKIKIHFLPPYSPNLNPIERLWKIMREQVMYNQYYESFDDFTNAMQYFFKTIGKKKSILRSRITDNFQILHSPLFAS